MSLRISSSETDSKKEKDFSFSDGGEPHKCGFFVGRNPSRIFQILSSEKLLNDSGRHSTETVSGRSFLRSMGDIILSIIYLGYDYCSKFYLRIFSFFSFELGDCTD